MKIFKRFILLAGIVAISFSDLFSKELSECSEVSVLTCTPGKDLYSLFGHSALRFKDPAHKIDLVFNYGTFDFNTPNFYTKFARGQLKYCLSCSTYEQFCMAYIHEERGIVEQKLNLDFATKNKLFKAVLENYEPHNRYYNYDFLFDNCATRIRDIIEENVNGMAYNNKQFSNPKTFWDLLDQFMENSRWIYLGIHLVLGSPCNVEATPHQYQFLPDYMMQAFSEATILKNGSRIPLVYCTNEVLKAKLEQTRTVWYLAPWFIFGLIASLILAISIFCLRKGKSFFVIDHLLFGITGLLGWLIVFLWFFTNHQATAPNWNILWALPIHFPMANLLLWIKSKKSHYYFLLNAIFILMVLASWTFIPQSLPNEMLPIVALLFIRSLFVAKKLKPEM